MARLPALGRAPFVVDRVGFLAAVVLGNFLLVFAALFRGVFAALM